MCAIGDETHVPTATLFSLEAPHALGQNYIAAELVNALRVPQGPIVRRAAVVVLYSSMFERGCFFPFSAPRTCPCCIARSATLSTRRMSSIRVLGSCEET
jgi:hypothetical protein